MLTKEPTRHIVLIISVLLAITMMLLFTLQRTGSLRNIVDGEKACTMEAKLCPDGSAVGRTGPNCEFSACPSITPQSSPTITPSTSPVSTAGWKTYRNNEYGVVVKYPFSFIQAVDVVPMSDFGNKAYFLASKDRRGLSVAVWDTSTYSFDELKDPSPEVQLKTTENINIDSHMGIKFTYNSVGDNNSGVLPGQRLSIFKNNLVYIIECGGYECSEILSTFKFTN